MDIDPIPTDNIDIEEARDKFNGAVAAIWEVAEELGVEALSLSEAEAEIDRIIDDASL